MATIITLSLRTGKHLAVPRQAVLPQVERAEKKNFPRHEAFNFHLELNKRNLELVIVLKDDDDGTLVRETSIVAAYAVFVHSKPSNVVMLHKICVLAGFRRQGIAEELLITQTEKYAKRGRSKIQLWVDDQNVPARSLYKRLGFQEIKRAEEYYAPGRTGVRMSLNLISS